ncbi:hypothetical protein BJV77DRAFT_991198 [Russula vinacea]|nr:hypothetical protein BJV77DRAFT_991198 [Russula vinacea]
MPRVKSPHTSSHRAQTKGRLFHNTNGSRVEDDEQQWPILHERTGGNLVNAGASPPALGASGKMSDEWTGTLNLNGACVPARAKATEAVQNPKLTTWPKDLQLDLANGPDISTLDIQTWIYETKAPVVLLRCIDGTTDDWQFDQLVEELRNSGSYATVRWKYRGQILDRLLLAPVGKALLCAAFPDDGIPKRPKSHPSRQLRALRRGGPRSKKRPPPGPRASHGNIDVP